MKQVKISITTEEWELAEKAAKEQSYTSTTAYIRHLLRSKCKEDVKN